HSFRAVATHSQSPSPLLVTQYSLYSKMASTTVSSLPPIICYTDGSCREVNGKGVASGIGIYFGPAHPLNTSKRLDGPRHESGVAEIIAVQIALTKIHKWSGFNNQSVIIRTDYMGIIDAMVNRNYGRFAEMYDDLRKSAEKFPSGVTFDHVVSHEGEEGNEEADRLARMAINLGVSIAKSRRGHSLIRSKSAHVKGRRSAIARRSGPGVTDVRVVPSPVPNRRKVNKRKRAKANRIANESALRFMNNQ
ncbi:rnh-1.1, partial [Pristionchus pacificus]